MLASEGGIPSNEAFFSLDGAAVFITPVDKLTINIEGWGGWDIDTLSDAHVETNFLGNFFRREVGSEFVEIASIACDVFKVLNKKGGALASRGVFPLRLIFEEEIGVCFPVALKAGGFGGGSGGGAVLVVRQDVVTVDDGELAIGSLDSGIDAWIYRGAAGALEIGVLKNNNRRVGVALDVVADIASVLIAGNDGIKVVIVVISGFIVAIDN